MAKDFRMLGKKGMKRGCTRHKASGDRESQVGGIKVLINLKERE